MISMYDKMKSWEIFDLFKDKPRPKTDLYEPWGHIPEFLHDILYEKIINEVRTLTVKKEDTTDVSCKKFPSMLYCITIAPPDNSHCDLLEKLLLEMINSKGCKMAFGVFEVGRKRDNFHTHILFECNDKNTIQNFIKKISKTKFINKVDKIKSSVQLLKTLRYMLSHEKHNKGIIKEINLQYFIDLCNTNQTLLNQRCTPSEFMGKIRSIY